MMNNLVLKYYLSNKKASFKLVFSFVIVFSLLLSFLLLRLSFINSNQRIKKEYMHLNVYELDGNKQELFEKDNIETYRVSNTYISNAKIMINGSFIKEEKMPFTFISFGNNTIESGMFDAIETNYIGKKNIGENEVVISTALANYITTDYNSLIGKKISISATSYKNNDATYDESICYLDNCEIVGIYDQLPLASSSVNSVFYSNNPLLIRNEDNKYSTKIEKTRIRFDTFRIEKKIKELDEKYNGMYFGKDVYNQIAFSEKEGEFVTKLFFVFGILLISAICLVVALNVNYSFKNTRRFLYMLNILGYPKKRILCFLLAYFCFIIALSSFMGFLIAAIIVSNIDSAMLNYGFEGSSVINILGYYSFSLLAIFVYILFVYMICCLINFKKESILKIK